MELVIKKLLRNTITLLMVTILITFLVSLPKDFNFNYSFGEIIEQTEHNLVDVRDSLLGTKKYNGVPIQDTLFTSFARSYKLIFLALLISIFLGIIKGITDFNVEKQDTSVYRLLHTLFMLSIPDILLIIIFRISIKYIEQRTGVRILPLTGYQNTINLILPAITLAIVPIVYVARATTTTLKQIYKKPYMLVAKGKGLPSLIILFKHGVRNCLNTIFDNTMSAFNIIMSSLLIVEMFYYYPGVTLQMLTFYQRGHTFMFIIYAFFLGLLYVILDLVVGLMKIYFDPERRGELSGLTQK